MAWDRAVCGTVIQKTEPWGDWAARSLPRDEPNHGGSVRSVQTAAVCGTVVNSSRALLKRHDQTNDHSWEIDVVVPSTDLVSETLRDNELQYSLDSMCHT